jgi:hypothetical protein
MLHMPCQMQELHKGKLYICYKGALTHQLKKSKKHQPPPQMSESCLVQGFGEDQSVRGLVDGRSWLWWMINKGLSTRFQVGASSCPQSISKTTTPVLLKPYKWECTEECTLIPDPRSVVSSSPPPKYPKHLLLPVFPTHAKNHYSHPNTCITKLSIYTRLYSSRTIKDRIFKAGM